MALPVKVKRPRKSQFDFIARLRRPNGSDYDFKAVLGSKQGAENRAGKIQENNPDAEFMVLTLRDLVPADGTDTPEANIPYVEALEAVENTPDNQGRKNPKSGVIVLRTA